MKKNPRVVCLVPSWTETLLWAGVEVVGRTRYCIHPADRVHQIPIVGGTKNVDWEKVNSTGGELLILDREENPKSFATDARFPWHASHVTDIANLPQECLKLSELFTGSTADRLRDLSRRWEGVISNPGQTSFKNIFGLKEWIVPPQEQNLAGFSEVAYVIWKNPWMIAGPPTFIGSMLKHLGFHNVVGGISKYPEIQLSDLDPRKTLLLFSSEPYPFHREKEKHEIQLLGFTAALIDGEVFSWFGLRSLLFLERILR